MIDLTGKISGILRGKRTILQIEIEEEIADTIVEMMDKPICIQIKRKNEKRSLNSNSYFHVLCDKLRKRLGISMARCKNMLITSYGQPQYIKGEPAIISSNIPPEYMQEQELLHCDPIPSEGHAWSYMVYRGSHTYDSEEMNRLIEGTIQECKDQGIETATPDELARMAALWREKYGQQTGEE